MGLICSTQNVFKLIRWVDIIASLLLLLVVVRLKMPLLLILVFVLISTIVIIQVVHFGTLISLVEALIAAQMLLLVGI